MFHIDAVDVICTLWETLRPRTDSGFPRPGTGRVNRETGFYRVEERGLMTTVEIHLSHYSTCDEDADIRKYALVHTLFTADTSVFVAVARQNEKWTGLSPEEFKNTSNHDSCWRTDGMIEFRVLAQKLQTEIEKGRPGVSIAANPPPFDRLSQFCSLGALGSKPWEFVTVTHEENSGDYRKRRILSITRETKYEQT